MVQCRYWLTERRERYHVAVLVPRVEGPRKHLETRWVSIWGMAYQSVGDGVMRLENGVTALAHYSRQRRGPGNDC